MKTSIGVGLLLGVLSAAVTTGQTFTVIDDGRGVSSLFRAGGVSGDGSVAVGFSNTFNEFFYGFRADARSGDFDYVVPDDPYTWSVVNATDHRGERLVGGVRLSPEAPIQAAAWDASGDFRLLGTLPDASVLSSSASDVSSTGQWVVGRSSSGEASQAFRWSESTGMSGLGFLGTNFLGQLSSSAIATDRDGTVVVGGSSSNTTLISEAFRWTEELGMEGLGTLDGSGIFSQAYGVSADGTTIVGSSTASSGTEGFIWTRDGGMRGLGKLEGDDASYANDVSANGSVIVGTSGTGATRQPVVWVDEGQPVAIQDLLVTDFGIDLTGWTLTFAYAVSDDGRTIVGEGIAPSGAIRGWIATIPSPGTPLLIAASATVLAKRRRI